MNQVFPLVVGEQKCCKRLPIIRVLQHGAAPGEVLGMGKVLPHQSDRRCAFKPTMHRMNRFQVYGIMEMPRQTLPPPKN